MDIEKESNREAFEAIPRNARLLRGAKFKDGEYVALSLFDESSKELAAQLNYGWSIWQAAKAQAIPDGFEIGRLQDRIVELLDERQELYAQLDRAEEDSKRINFLADKNQWIANVQLPREIVERNLSSLRNAIDRAMDLAALEPTND